MKCEKCNNNEVSFVYESNINGKKTSRHLCAECAKAEGLDKAFINDSVDFFGDFPFGASSLFSDFSAPRRSLLGGFGMPTLARSLLAPAFPRFFLVNDTDNESESEKSCCENESCSCGKSGKASEETDAELDTKRKLEALRYELRQAVNEENFEKAITLRDEIRQIEGR